MKLRTNHNKSNVAGNMLTRMVIFVGLILLLFLLFRNLPLLLEKIHVESEETLQDLSDELGNRYFLPKSSGEVIHHTYYSLSYLEDHEQAEWVAYELNKESLRLPKVPRTNWFEPDPKVTTLSAVHADYIRSGYDRGHLVPAADMAFSEDAMKETFFMSNISPQVRQFNHGIWRELEEQVRDWAFKSGQVVVVSGPVLTKDIKGKIGKNGVSVPAFFYKIVLDVSSNERNAIAFIIPNAMSDRPLQDYAVSIDSVESKTGIDFFAYLYDQETQNKIESGFDIGKWRFSESRYKLRVEKWNKE